MTALLALAITASLGAIGAALGHVAWRRTGYLTGHTDYVLLGVGCGFVATVALGTVMESVGIG